MATLYIVRGAPGSGKSTLARRLGHAVSADDFMVDASGNYAFDPTRLAEVHAKCLARVRELLETRADVAVCNVFQRVAHVLPYRKLAQALGAQIFELECLNDFGNEHDVPRPTVERMRRGMER